jgi:undecaprenyl-diphosphatase
MLLTAAFDLSAEALDRENVNAFDRPLMFSYSKTMDTVSDFTQYASFLAPAAFLFDASKDDYLGIGIMYGSSTALALGARYGLKAVFDRERPYMYFADPPAELIASGDNLDSFPSGHTIMAFSGAAFTATLFALKYPDSKWRVPVTTAAYALAGTTAVLRVSSGSHFTSDVLTGAVIGSFTGFIVPFVSYKAGWVDGRGGEGGSGLTITPTSIGFTHRY